MWGSAVNAITIRCARRTYLQIEMVQLIQLWAGAVVRSTLRSRHITQNVASRNGDFQNLLTFLTSDMFRSADLLHLFNTER